MVDRNADFHDPFGNGADLTVDQFVEQIAMRGSFDSPLWNNVPNKDLQARSIYKLIKDRGHNSAVWLGIGIAEHQLGTAEDSVLKRNDTRSWTNARSVRDPSVHGTVIRDPVRGSNYVKYDNVRDSVMDGIYRIDEPGYDYQQAGATTLGEIFKVWTEGDWEGYADFVAGYVSSILTADDVGEPGIPNDDGAFLWIPDTSEFGYPQGTHGRNGVKVDRLIIHITVGNDSLAWLNGNHGSSAHYLTWKDGSPRAQMVREADAAWTAGNREFNLRGINFEHEHDSVNTPFTDEEYQNIAESCARIVLRNPGILVDRTHVIGHAEVPDPNNPGKFGGAGNHIDPGYLWNWERFMALLAQEVEKLGMPHDPILMLNGYEVKWGFRDYFLNQGKAKFPQDAVTGGISVFGLPLGNEYRTEFGSAQRFERMTMIWNRGYNPPFDLTGTFKDENDPPEVFDAD